ncbi:3'(2'),5'-bisphosphate nucleotidase CysQ [Pseudoroseomonas ludipueritiae]|uniref:3'(2'),5'-bisphosphate nucleotidase CysQ n=1 Tax=Pseudoroseomonas ludipueritiae TaxID=198093 RepID=A0ABR7RA87_9PROT|nr:3'(2'),5'-bisphosphate nucleotidase CysQ [Pseudoroseomonas ludipueritiae]MBC9178681.1 3'(2'),5'-bisphosphate nucleotidase CysQ [Pseudoroseomonas ludipueritiae]MCG7362587.1 3'(2'),5'-bisphosphate nucleotidase CysQ [Roseomonas sp. ACRSG]
MTDADLLALATRLARSAAEAILSVRAAGFAVEQKTDMSPVTAADRLAEGIILEGLRAATPDIPVVAEEECSAGAIPRVGGRFWSVDPLDGTREFAAGREEFTVNIGLVVEGRPHLGAVALPAFGEVFTGIVGQGAWKLDAGGQRPIAARRAPEEGITVFASRHYAGDPRLAEFLKGRRVAKVHEIGSAVKFCRLAEGLGDLYPRFGRTMEWDTAAPEAVLVAAGGRCTAMDGITPLAYGKPGWENPPFLCQGQA